jgi:hypothetical protein
MRRRTVQNDVVMRCRLGMIVILFSGKFFKTPSPLFSFMPNLKESIVVCGAGGFIGGHLVGRAPRACAPSM